MLSLSLEMLCKAYVSFLFVCTYLTLSEKINYKPEGL